MTSKFICFNGPASSGKDAAVKLLQIAHPEMKMEKFARPLKDGARALYGLTQEQFDFWDREENKNTPTSVFMGKSCRQVQIGISEQFLKPFHNDKQVFGKLLLQRVKDQPGLYGISDSGFAQELLPLEEHFGASNMLLIRIRRPGKTYEGDSRDYVYSETIPSLDLDNNGTLEDFGDLLLGLTARYLK